MNSGLTTKSRAVRVVAGLTIIVAIMAFAFNGFLLFSVFDGKKLVENAEIEAGRELSGYELYSDHPEIGKYYYPDREFQGDFLYFSSAISIPLFMLVWIVVSIGCLVLFLRIVWNSRQMRTVGFGLLGLMVCLLGAVIPHLGLLKKIAWAID